MDPVKRHLSLFPPRLRNTLQAFPHWESICEIRLRRDAALSLTSFKGNITINESGVPCPISRGMICRQEELSYLIGSFCGGSVYRYFDRLQDGFAVDQDGWRLGVCTQKSEGGFFLPDQILGINLRIPRQAPLAAKPIVEKMKEEGAFSLLICSPPGDGKTTMLRSLGAMLSLGDKSFSPLRVVAVDERGELYPANMKVNTGLLDVLPFHKKGEGIQLATRIFSPQIILCDEIGSMQEADAILCACSGGCSVIASAHAASMEEAKRTPVLAKLMDSGKFRYVLFLNKEDGEAYRCRLQWEKAL